MTIDDLLLELNESQRAAATLPSQHAMVIAGAGCGKTKTIVARAAYLISKGVPPQRIQILTFTRRSASEVVHRVRSHLGDTAKGLQASTFHSWCMNVIRMAPEAFGCQGFSVIDREDQMQMFKLARGNIKDKDLPKSKEILDFYSYARNTKQSLGATLQKVAPELESQKAVIAEVMKSYEAKKRERRYLDYDDILDVVAQRLSNSPETRDWLSKHFEFVLVDEMQDTNPLQWSLLEPLSHQSILFCVGDDAQSIYGFRGADFQNVHSFTERVPNSILLKLEENYRSTQPILDISNWLLAQSSLGYDKNLRSMRGDGNKPALMRFENEWEEATWISEDLLKRHDSGAEWRDHMILVRTGFAGRTLETSFLARNIPYTFIGGLKLLESAHIRDVLSLLRLVANPTDDLAWARFLTLWPGIGERTASRCVTAIAGQTRIEECVSALQRETRLGPAIFDAITRVEQVKLQASQAFAKAVESLEPSLEEKYKNQDWDKRKRDFLLVEKLAERHTSILSFIEDYMLDPVYTSEVEGVDSTDRVTLITIHSAKGAESPVCYVVDVSPGSYPSVRSMSDPEEVEEERRVLYVALTRAKDELIITRRSASSWAKWSFPGKNNDDAYFFNNLPIKLVTQGKLGGKRHQPPTPPPPAAGPIHVGIQWD
ncbi:ATP-dependent DNA helicase PcrA [Pirellula sp. SH-Sr6A]|uniref:ATP-dependent helicase n=1 Tax=Pirellula sp. SH-Sr6A TaxID=1632865 RepID=UPI00078DC31D|nr:ATP-dependent helicase [Pirellula sp. SH-Sr6A]AMV34772.1 ATP-dependent DNA helicase PcrA [Pirellula sp. SH-Sr6A]